MMPSFIHREVGMMSTLLCLGSASVNLGVQKAVFVLLMPSCICCLQVCLRNLAVSCVYFFFFSELLVRKTVVNTHDGSVLQPGGNYQSCQKLPNMWYCLQCLGVHLCGLYVSLKKVLSCLVSPISTVPPDSPNLFGSKNCSRWAW